MDDQQTHDYFDQFTPHYDPSRFDFAIDFLRRHAGPEQTLIDIGCGDGATLHLVKSGTSLERLYGLDISANYLAKARELTGCETIQGSILDDALVAAHAGRFDFSTLGAVLHHLIGSNRAQSAAFARQCLRNAIELLKPGGYLIIFEPTYGPSWLMDVVFWIKKSAGRFTDQRIEIVRQWANFGQPVVSYYTPEEMDAFVADTPRAESVERVIVDRKRKGPLIRRVGLGLVIRRRAD